MYIIMNLCDNLEICRAKQIDLFDQVSAKAWKLANYEKNSQCSYEVKFHHLKKLL